MKKNYKWIIWFPKKWTGKITLPSILYGYLDGEIFISTKYLYVGDTNVETKLDGFQSIDENFKENFYYEFFDSKEDIIMISKELQDEQYKIEKEYHNKIKNFHTRTSLKKMKNKIRKLKLDKIENKK